MTVSLRRAAAEDARALSTIFEISFTETFGHLYQHQDLAAFLSGFSVEAWERQLSDEAFTFILAETAGRAVGFLKLGPLKLPIETPSPALLLDQLYVLKEEHGTGIAHQLMDLALARAAQLGARELYLTVYVDNHRARRFYERYEFEPVGRYDFMVGNHADEDIIMRKGL